jgi:hypothetical protein
MTIEQCDRDAVADYHEATCDDGAIYAAFRRGECDNHPDVQFAASIRLAERARCFAYIREQAGECSVLAAGINQIDWARAEDHQPIIGEDGAVNVDATFNGSGASTVGHDIFAAFADMLDHIERTDNATK